MSRARCGAWGLALGLIVSSIVGCDDAAGPEGQTLDAAPIADARAPDARAPEAGRPDATGPDAETDAAPTDATPPDATAGCRADTDCQANYWCDVGEGVCRFGCRHDPDDCPPGFACNAQHVCQAACQDAAPCQTELPGPCADGVTVCQGGEATCEPRVPATDEACNALDDDCDGQTDEAFPELGEPCEGGVGVCAGRGTWTCAPDGAGVVCARAGQAPEAERCDGLDNDCDGETDETFADLGDPCVSGLGACAAEGARTCTADGDATRCDAAPAAPGVEICNAIDDDCDGTTDEAFEGAALEQACYSAAADTRGVGACREGTQICQDGAWGACAGEQGPSPERCNAVDDDCDGEVDNAGAAALTEGCYGGAPGTEGVGPCRGGFRLCVGGVWSACQGARTPVEEICDLADNDCDGVADNLAEACECIVGEQRDCYAGPEGTLGVGPCRGGQQACVSPGRWGECIGQVLPEGEICNRVDDDCNGARDDDVPGVGLGCRIGQGLCASEGVTQCAILGGFRCDAAFIPPAPERCDTRDNDCDGATDEAFPVGDACAVGAGACARPGVLSCTALEEFRCEAQAGEGGAEICNQLDDDCDGRVDEDFGTGQACSAGQGACRVVGVTVCDGEGQAICAAEAGAPSPEICNGQDDDCDGAFDEGFGRGDPCVAGQGVCAVAGTIRCDADGESVCSAEAAAPSLEVCDGFDNDCDGVTDEALVADRPCNTDVPGVCRRGLRTCIGGDLVCISVNEPALETCNTLDDDCDGQVDEVGTLPCGSGVCRRDLPACEGGERPECDPLVGQQPRELCNGLDDDCDGATDEDAAGAGRTCGQGRGGCARLGTFTCDQGFLVCDAEPGEPSDEACNGVDDDCDGTTDEASVAPEACVTGVGACARPGLTGCVEGGVGCVGEPGAPVAELCNGLDDNCDGTIDEGFGAQICGEGVCRRVLANCAGGAEAPPCDAFQGAGPEICNGLDDDCDGTTDEDTPGVGEACVGGLGVCQGPGQTGCVGGRLGCVVPDAAQPEVCNGLDDDCDGATDEDAAQVGDLCTAGRGECARAGQLTCGAAGLVCDVAAGDPAPEICDGLDDDCNGAADDGLGTVPCGVGRCLRDLPACTNGEPPACAPLQGAIAEQCNGIDDDCDGVTDEDSPQVGDPCRVGLGACLADGVRQCVQGALVCDAPLLPPGAETCNGLDDDCDLRVDEDFGAGRLCRAGEGVCATFGRVICTDDGASRCDAELPEPGVEQCDGFDDDCDGATDEGLQDQGPCAAPVGFGVCAVGRLGCQNAQPICRVVTEPADEICDGLDNDCDANTDEGLGSAPCGVGACARDLPDCADGQPTQCDPLAGATPEVCNGVDDDCDGTTDEAPEGEGDPCNTGLGACAAVGVRRCVAGAPTCDADVPEAQDERCNAVDDDCDGLVDEDTLESFAACSAGVGVCERDAFFECDAGAVRCPAVAGNPTGNEQCNGLDDDCDGEADEGFGAQLCGVGRCQHVLPNCDGGGAPACEPLAGARAETCNGIDDDCDGVTDEDAPGSGRACGGGIGTCRRDGVTVCVDGALGCDALPGNPGVEICNGRDDDCDGTTDEAPTDAGGDCTVGLGQCSAQGVEACVLGRLRCSVEAGPPAEEICNGLDDDCDLAIDEGLGDLRCGLGVCERVVSACENGRPGQCDPFDGARPEACNGADDDCDGQFDEAQGVLSCGVGDCAKQVPACVGGLAGVCDPEAGAGDELCDGRDNDCDGVIDEDPRGDNTACSDGVGRCERLGTQRCLGGALICDAVAGLPTGETCNGADDDCDGTLDEDPSDDLQPCEVGIGGCARQGVGRCTDGRLVCDAVPGAPQAEICNELDDDCDFATDEAGPDCNRNGYGDACDIASGRSTDCNANALPDDCDIAAGTSRDCNRDGDPDECFPDRGCDFDITPPTVQITTVVAAVVAGRNLDIRVLADDNLALDRVGMTRDGVEVPVGAFGIADVPFPTPGYVEVEAYAFDRAGNRGSARLFVRVLHPATDPVARPSRAPDVYRMCAPDTGCPVARVATPRVRTTPGGVVQLDATPSTGATRYRWTVVRSPTPVAISEAFPGDPAQGGPGDDPLTPTAEIPVPVPGLYEVTLAVEAADGTPAPTAACPSAGGVMIEVQAAGPVRADGADCDTSWATDRCGEAQVCRTLNTDDGVGLCAARLAPLGEREPDNGPNDMTTTFVGPGTQIVGRLDPCNGDGRDVFALRLERAGLFTVETTDLDGLCAGDTRLTRLRPEVFEAHGLADALGDPIALDDDGGLGKCSRLELDSGNPGLYVFVVDSPRGHFAFDYALRITERAADETECDPLGIELRCRAPAVCVDANRDGEGHCLRP